MQNLNEMLDHLNEMIIRTRASLDIYQSLCDRISVGKCPDCNVTAAATAHTDPEPRSLPKRSSIQPQRRQPKSRITSQAGTFQDQVLEVINTMDGPFTQEDLAKLIPGAKRKAISNVIIRLIRHGQMKRTSCGHYARTNGGSKSTAEAYREFRAGIDVKVPEINLKTPSGRADTV